MSTGGWPPAAEALAAAVRAYRPAAGGSAWASTALVVGEGGAGPSVLLIRRVERDGDPWSGHMALPGGKVDPEDASPEAAAVRETAEEVGLAIGAPVGRLDDVTGRPVARRIATTVFTVDGTPALVPEPGEVAEAIWLPVRELAAPPNQTWYRYGGIVPFRSITVDDYMIWGLTHRILTHFFAITGVA